VENFAANKQVCEKLSRWCLNDAYMRRSTPCPFERMTHICVIQLRRYL